MVIVTGHGSICHPISACFFTVDAFIYATWQSFESLVNGHEPDKICIDDVRAEPSSSVEVKLAGCIDKFTPGP